MVTEWSRTSAVCFGVSLSYEALSPNSTWEVAGSSVVQVTVARVGSGLEVTEEMIGGLVSGSDEVVGE